MQVVDIDQQSRHLEDVIKLASANTSRLGFLPKGAFIQAARQRDLLVALDDQGNFLGYLLYGIAQKKMLAYIVHLCVLLEQRKNKIATHLVQTLKDITKNSLRGIRVHCRRGGKRGTFYFLKSWRWYPANGEAKTSRYGLAN